MKIGPWIFFTLTAVIVFHNLEKIKREFSLKELIFLGFAWVLFIQAEGILPGPFSRLEWGDGDRLFTGYYPWLAAQDGATFLFNLMGGVDRYSFGRIGGEFFSLRLTLMKVMPLWTVIVLLRLIVPLVALLGVYLFSSRLLHCPTKLAFALGALYSVGYDFTATLTFLYGISLAGIPLLLYLLFSGRNDLRSWLYLAGFGLFYIGTSDPIYWAPAIWVTVGTLHFWVKPRSKAFAYPALALFTAIWLVNYAETIYAMLLMLPFSARGTSEVTLTSVWWHIDWLMGPAFRYNHPGPLFAIPFFFALCVGIFGKSRISLRAALTSLMLGLSTVPLARIPWDDLGLQFLKTYRWYWEYVALGIVLLAAAGAAGSLGETTRGKHVRRWATAVTIALAITMSGILKIENLLQTLTRGNLASLTNIPNLLTPAWQHDLHTRVVSLPGLLDTNSLVNYGFATYDGGATLVSRDVNTFWNNVILSGPKVSREALGFGLYSAFNQCCQPLDIDALADLNLLRLAGVRYLFSYRPVSSVYLTQVDGPITQGNGRKLTNIFSDPDPVRVYEVARPLPRVWWATKTISVSESASEDEIFIAIRAHALSGGAVVASGDESSLQPSPENYPPFAQQSNDRIVISTSGQGGVLLINQAWLPWWAAVTDNGSSLVPYKANLIHMALAIPKGTRSVTLSYKRPMLRDRLGINVGG
jgi:hypothetical protein